MVWMEWQIPTVQSLWEGVTIMVTIFFFMVKNLYLVSWTQMIQILLALSKES